MIYGNNVLKLLNWDQQFLDRSSSFPKQCAGIVVSWFVTAYKKSGKIALVGMKPNFSATILKQAMFNLQYRSCCVKAVECGKSTEVPWFLSWSLHARQIVVTPQGIATKKKKRKGVSKHDYDRQFKRKQHFSSIRLTWYHSLFCLNRESDGICSLLCQTWFIRLLSLKGL